jgi:DNA-binding NarL/FixJ family response regulator
VTTRLLTPMEEQVARLVATGRSNPEIAEELDLTRKTVEWHLSRIYRKLGAHSRAELALVYQPRRAGRSTSSPATR